MNSKAQKMKCPKCRKEYQVDSLAFRCFHCNEPLEVIYDYDSLEKIISKESFKNRTWNLWRYLELLPIKDEKCIVSLSEGGTPLIKSNRLAELLGLNELYLKDESRNPTGSFKDRGSSIGISKALEIKVKIVGCASTGNMAASLSAYANRAGLKCIILIPQKTPLEKVSQILFNEPIVMSVNQPYPELYKMSFEMSRKFNVYLIHSDSPMRIEGQKTIAYEICEQMKWETPDLVVIPTSSGGNLSAIWKGFKEFYEIGLIKKLPRIVCVQSEGCAPIVKAFTEKTDLKPWPNPNTIAHSISNPNPILASGRRVLRILKENKGLAIAVSDEEIIKAQKTLAIREGILVEPASAASIAAITKLIENREISRNDKIVCILTGTGLKDMKIIRKQIKTPTQIKTWTEFEKQLNKIVKT